jgi:very-short-patch-repair endonuclease
LCNVTDMVTEPHAFARRLRQSATKAEDILWDRLRGSRLAGAKFKRQVPIDRYVVDFFCRAAGLVVEIDGRQHTGLAEYDEARTGAIEAAGAHVIRFTNEEVCNDLESVLQRIAAELRLPSE